ncbi:uracil-DNA glycosylase [Spirosoma oryzae]|uniref:Uracil-DNA glycosylase n=1 Tax=Spirosoma oryzae TaxID=1469603 RepID=A0A2T0SYJ5_9BACT|nr:hypothetical protein [Spirosoma oryzae]PRY38490.1 uracil-DNA glycosylase [Spirosoma oryzae]
MSSGQIKLTESYLLGADCFDSRWNRLPVPELLKAIELEKNLLLFDPTGHRYELVAPFVLEGYVKQVNDPDYLFVSIQAEKENPNWEISPYQREILKRFHYSWLNELGEYLYSDSFKLILSQVKRQRATQTIYPESPQLFRAFLQPLSSLRSIWINTAPYPSSQACGLSFAVEQGSLPEELLVLQQGIRDDLGLETGFSLEKSLVSLRKSGVMLLSAALTSPDSDPNGHVLLWSSFIAQVIPVLNRQVQLSWVLWGPVAGKLATQINPAHTIHCLNHSSWFSQNNTPLVTNVFSRLQAEQSIQFA